METDSTANAETVVSELQRTIDVSVTNAMSKDKANTCAAIMDILRKVKINDDMLQITILSLNSEGVKVTESRLVYVYQIILWIVEAGINKQHAARRKQATSDFVAKINAAEQRIEELQNEIDSLRNGL